MSRTFNLKFILKKIKNSSLLSFILKNLIHFYIRLLFATYRLEVKSNYNFQKPLSRTDGVFYFWHQNIIAASCLFFKNNAIGHCIVSPSGDGKIVGYIAQKLGFKCLYGSGYKRSVNVVRQALDVLQANKRLCIVGDGSRGPALKLQRGVIYLASKSKLPLIFIECKSQWNITFNSWDKFQLPLPFSKISIKIHTPVIPSPDAYKEF